MNAVGKSSPLFVQEPTFLSDLFLAFGEFYPGTHYGTESMSYFDPTTCKDLNHSETIFNAEQRIRSSKVNLATSASENSQ